MTMSATRIVSRCTASLLTTRSMKVSGRSTSPITPESTRSSSNSALGRGHRFCLKARSCAGVLVTCADRVVAEQQKWIRFDIAPNSGLPILLRSRPSASSSARTRPGCGDSTRMREPTRIASSIEWVTNSTVNRSWSHNDSNSCCIVRRVSASSAANGSSISRISGSSAIARAMATRIFMPPDSICG